MPVIQNTEVQFEEVAPGWKRRIMINEERGPAGACMMGEVILDPGAGLKMHGHKIEEVFFITEGTGTVVIDGEATTVEQGGAILLPAGSKHTMLNKSQKPLRFAFFHPGIHVGRVVYES